MGQKMLFDREILCLKSQIPPDEQKFFKKYEQGFAF